VQKTTRACENSKGSELCAMPEKTIHHHTRHRKRAQPVTDVTDAARSPAAATHHEQGIRKPKQSASGDQDRGKAIFQDHLTRSFAMGCPSIVRISMARLSDSGSLHRPFQGVRVAGAGGALSLLTVCTPDEPARSHCSPPQIS